MSPKKLEKLYEEFATDDLSIEELREFESFHKKQEYGDSLMIESELSNLDSPKVFKDGWRTIYYDFSDENSFQSQEEIDRYIELSNKVPWEYVIKKLGMKLTGN